MTGGSGRGAGGWGCFGVFFTLFSAISFFLGIWVLLSELNSKSWEPVACEVSEFEVVTDLKKEAPFSPKVKFQYEIDGQQYTGTKFSENKDGVEKYEEIAEMVYLARKGELGECFVNPEVPDEAVLHRDDDKLLLGMIITLSGGLLVAIGIGVIVMGRRASRKSAMSSRKGEENTRMVLIPLFAIFACVGLGLLCFWAIPKLLEHQEMKGWVETPAEVVWSRVTSNSDSDGTTYGVDIFYRYEFDGVELESNRGGLVSSTSSGRSGKQQVVNDHPAGAKIVCFVNPERPWEVVRKREMGWSGLFLLFPLLFCLVGLIGLWYPFWGSKKEARLASGSQAAGHSANSSEKIRTSGGAVELKPGGKRVKGLLGVMFFALFWNGIVSVFVLQVYKAWRAGSVDWFLTLFMVPFVLVGVGSVLFAGYRFLGLFSPAPRLSLPSDSVGMGADLRVDWKVMKGAERFRHFAIYLVGTEQAEYRRGTDTKRETSVFYEEMLVETSQPRMIMQGSVSFRVPYDVVPTWEATNNKISWAIHVKGDLPFWPDVNDQYPVVILPMQPHQITS